MVNKAVKLTIGLLNIYIKICIEGKIKHNNTQASASTVYVFSINHSRIALYLKPQAENSSRAVFYANWMQIQICIHIVFQRNDFTLLEFRTSDRPN